MGSILKREFGSKLYSFNTDGWFNATEAAKRFAKEPFAWINQRETMDYIAALAEHQGNSGFVQEINEIKDLDSKSAKSRRLILDLVKKTGFVRTKKGPQEHGGGTWMHPKLAVPYARWLNVHFGVWCDLQIDTIIRSGIRAEGNANLLPLLLRQEPGVWELRFGPDYYRALARMTGTFYTGHAGGTPALYGAITDKWVYGGLLPDDVHAQLKACRGASDKMHQWLTRAKRAALDALANLGSNYVEWGTPPYAVSLLAAEMGVDLSNLTKTMRALERAGLVVREIARVECWNAISGDHMPRRCVCYWLAETMERDKAQVEAWNAGAAGRGELAWQAMRF